MFLSSSTCNLCACQREAAALPLRNQKCKDHCVGNPSVRKFYDGGKVPLTQICTFLGCVLYFSADISQTAEIFRHDTWCTKHQSLTSSSLKPINPLAYYFL